MTQDDLALKLPADLIYFRTREGVELRNAVGILPLRGKGLYELFDRLVPLLDGRKTLPKICEGLPEAKRKAVARFCSLLLEKGFLKAAPAAVDAIRSGEMSPYGGMIHYVGFFSNNPEEGFTAFRDSNLLLHGSELGRTALAHALIELGLAKINLWNAGASSVRIREYLSGAETRGKRSTFVDLDESGPPTPDKMALFDALVVCGDHEDENELEQLAAISREQGKVFLPGTLSEDLAVAGPLVAPGIRGCLQCANRSLAELGTSPILCPRGEDDGVFSRSPVMISLLANELALELFRYFTNVGQTLLRGTSLLIDAVSLTRTVTKHRTYANCPSCGRMEEHIV